MRFFDSLLSLGRGVLVRDGRSPSRLVVGAGGFLAFRSGRRSPTGQRACEPEIAQLERLAIPGHQDVLRLDVPVRDAALVARGDGLDELPREQAHLRRVQAARARLENLQQILLHVLKHQIQLTLAPERFLQAHDVFVFQRAEHLHLAQRGFAHVRVVVRLLELLHRDRLPGLLVPALQHHPVRALAHHPEDLVLVHRTADAAQCRAETESWL
mmetsp:Transcript_12335/g.51642  ORF Transcript_12335/g.51642 Transcript_12335/m.51642 type:complete len:213 (-) Transcript_12335:3587-4225(-)